jgi:UDP-glucose 4-epimerase
VIRACQRMGIDRIIHLPAYMSVDSRRSPLRAYELNVLGTLHVFEAASVLGLERVVCASTVAVYGADAPPLQREENPAAPSTVYGMTKLAVEQLGKVYAADRGLKFIALRPTRMYGPGRARGDLEEMLISFLRRDRVRWTAGAASELLSVRDGARAFAEATLRDLPPHRVYNLCSAQKHAAHDLLAVCAQAVPSLPFELEGPAPAIAEPDALLPRMASQRAARELQWRPEVGLQEGIEQLVGWLQRERKA